MGEVLAVKMRQSLPGFALFLLLAGCIGAKPAPQAARAPAGPVLEVALLNGQAKLAMTRIQSDRYGSIWSNPDGAQVFLRQGVLVGTRGLVADLMSADAPSVATLVQAPATHRRIYYYLDGNDTIYPIPYDCTVGPAEAAEAAGAAHALVESCKGPRGQFVNKFWIAADLSVTKSRQWIGSGVGYADISQQSAGN